MFFPVMSTPGLSGFLDLVYFPPNTWENRRKGDIKLYVLWPEDGYWRCEFQKVIKYGERAIFNQTSLNEKMESGLCLVYPTHKDLKERLESLPEEALWTTIPEWRATSGLKSLNAQTSYQSEIFPLPQKGSMLTFHPFIQYGQIENRLLILNVTKTPQILKSEIEFYDTKSNQRIGTECVRSNSVTTIYLDKYNFRPEQLPAFVSKGMAGIPFGLGISHDGNMLSMEHTHPPASLVLFGSRNTIQSRVKQNWFRTLQGDAD
jgi:hypothetical protein